MSVDDLTGKIFHRWTVTSLAPRPTAKSSSRWNVVCQCGAIAVVSGFALRSGKTKSCGCLRHDLKTRLKHGKWASKVYSIWMSMRRRCQSTQDRDFEYYGKRGIEVCERWLKFENFFEDMGAPPPGGSIDRIDNEKGYCKENCRWATAAEQSRNKRSNRNITHNGATKCLSDWAKEAGLSHSGLSDRLKRGWSFERAITEPSKNQTRKRAAA